MRFPRLTAVTKAAVSAVSSLFGDSAARPARGNGGWGWLGEPFAGAWQRGLEVDPIGGLTAFGAVYACLTLIASDIGKLAPLLLETSESGVNVPAPAAAPDWRALRKPNSYQTRNQFLRSWMLSKLMHGNAYVLKVREENRGKVIGLHVLDPRRVTPMVTPEGDVYYSLGGDDLAQIPGGGVVPAMEIIHDRCCTLWHHLIGVPPLYAAAMSATQGRRIQSNSSLFFENMSRPSGFLKVPGNIDEPKAQALKAAWEKNYSAGNLGRLAVLQGGMEYQAMTIPAEQAQLIDQLKWTAIDICGAFQVPPYKIGVGAMPTNNNVEALQQQYFSATLQTHIEDVEGLMTEGLEVAAGKCVEFDLSGLLRMDSAALMEMAARGVEKAIFTPDEARAKFRLLPKTGGDQLYLQQQNYSLAALAKRDKSADPFGAAKPEPAPAPQAAPGEGADEDESSAEDQKRIEAIVAKAVEAQAALMDQRSAESREHVDAAVAAARKAAAAVESAQVAASDMIAQAVAKAFAATNSAAREGEDIAALSLTILAGLTED